jgi:uncharacterized protein YggE
VAAFVLVLPAGAVFSARQVLARDNVGAPVKAASANHTISVAGHGEVRVAPDMATLSVSVQTKGTDAQSALSANGSRMSAVIDAIKAQGVSANHIQTGGLSLWFDQQNDDYYASHELSVRIDKVNNVGGVLDAAVAAGATSSWGVSFGFKDPSTGKTAALQSAVTDAQKRAQSLATALGVSISGVGAVAEASYSTSPPVYAAGSVAAPAPVATTPVQAGELTVTADINVVYTFG